jgi:hypothetical protein
VDHSAAKQSKGAFPPNVPSPRRGGGERMCSGRCRVGRTFDDGWERAAALACRAEARSHTGQARLRGSAATARHPSPVRHSLGYRAEARPQGERRMVAQICPRWNPLTSWMRQIEDFQRAA